jgi:hypothetical protein
MRFFIVLWLAFFCGEVEENRRGDDVVPFLDDFCCLDLG